MKRFLQEEEKRGSFAIDDPDLRAAFWTAVAEGILAWSLFGFRISLVHQGR